MGGPGGSALARAVRPPGHGGTTPEAERPQTASGHGRGGTPGPIPNPEVKPPSADCTAGPARGRPGRRWPTGGVFARRGPAPSAGPLSVFSRGPSSACPGRARPGARPIYWTQRTSLPVLRLACSFLTIFVCRSSGFSRTLDISMIVFGHRFPLGGGDRSCVPPSHRAFGRVRC